MKKIKEEKWSCNKEVKWKREVRTEEDKLEKKYHEKKLEIIKCKKKRKNEKRGTETRSHYEGNKAARED